MIETEEHYRVTLAEIAKFEEANSRPTEQGIDGEGDDASTRRLQVDTMQCQLADLRAEVDACAARQQENALDPTHPQEVITLSARDSEMFLESILNPRPPNDQLREAFRRYRELFIDE